MSNSLLLSAPRLRKLAEELLERGQATPSGLDPHDSVKLINELQIHQIELELQNKALLESQQEIAGHLEQFKELYDLAPVAYFTLNPAGRILKTNVLGRKLLGNPLSAPTGLPFSAFVSLETLYVFRDFLERCFNRRTIETVRLAMIGPDDQSMINVFMEGIVEDDRDECRLVVIDLSRLG